MARRQPPNWIVNRRVLYGPMTRNLFILGILLGLVLLAGGLIQYRYQSFVDQAPVEPVAPPPEFLPVELPTFERLRSPHAILVLDVSGSMKDSDPSHLQSEAVLQFYSVYRDLASEILAKDDAARVAVVLFGTIAQTIDWRGDGDPWLDVSAANTASFRDAIDEYLGHPGTEPRTSQETDYLAAMDEVHRVVDGLPSPPAILFMTDGGNDPHILFTPGVPASQKAARLGALSGHQRQVFENVASGRRRWLRPKSATPIFNRRAEGFDPAALTSAQMAVVRPSIGLAVSAKAADDEKKINETIGKLTLDEKITLLSGAIVTGEGTTDSAVVAPAAAVIEPGQGSSLGTLGFQSLMEYIQLILSTFNAPLFALVALAVILPRRAAGGGRAGFLIGLASAVTHQILAMTHVLHYGSQMAANFYGAILGFCVALVCTLWIGSLRASAERAPRWRQSFDGRPVSIAWPALAAGIGLAGLCVAFNVFFW